MRVLLLAIIVFVIGLPTITSYALQPNVWTVSDGNCQSAIDNAQPGDTISIDVGVPCKQNIRLRKKTGTSPITIQTSQVSGLPPDGTQVSPAHDVAMAKILAPAGGLPAIEADAGAGNYRFLGIYISTDYAGGAHGPSFLIALANGNDANPNYGQWLSHDVTFDRCHIAGKFGDSRFAFAIAGERMTVINSRIDEFAGGPGTDSAAFWFSNAGGHRVENNYVSAGMWNVFMGGADSDSPNRATLTSATTTQATFSNLEGVAPAVGDLVAFNVWLRPDQTTTWKPSLAQWQPNVSYSKGATLWAGQDFLGRPRFFFVEQPGNSGDTEPNWNSTDEYGGRDRLQDGSVVWRYFNGQFMVGKVTGVSGNTITYAPEGPTGIVLPPIPNSVIRWNGYNPSLIFRRNHVVRPKAWAALNAPNKGMVQIKNATDTLFEGNFWDVEDTLGMGLTPDQEEKQRPGLIALTPGNQGYSAPWSTARNITIRYNLARHIESCFNWSLYDYVKTNVMGGNIAAYDNLFEDVLHGFALVTGGFNVTLRHNTVLNKSQKPLMLFGTKVQNLTYEDNIVAWNEGAYLESGDLFLQNVNGGSEANNVFVDMNDRTDEGYPPKHYFPRSRQVRNWDELKISADGRLANDSPMRARGTDGSDPGADISMIQAALGGSLPSSVPSPIPTPILIPSPTVVPTATPTPPGAWGARTYRGYLDSANCTALGGWAWDGVSDGSLTVSVYIDNVRVGYADAEQFRRDLLSAGIGNGKHGWTFLLPNQFRDGLTHSVSARVGSTQLLNIPQTITCQPTVDAGKGIWSPGLN
jgi:hypothetical protein